MSPSESYEFGDFILDVPERRLCQGSRAIPLSPKTHDVLVALLRRAGELVTKHELLDLVWPESFVEEGILAVHVSALRKALGPDPAGRPYIETVPRSGYRFLAAVRHPNGNGRAAHVAIRPEVYELFGRGRSHVLAASMSSVPQTVEAFGAAIEMLPTYAGAHAGLALAHCAQAEFRLRPASEAYPEAKTAALTALAMDDSCADGHVALGAVLYLSEWNWAGAERALSRALELHPHHTEAYLLYGRMLETLGNLERGLEMKQKALERDPFSPMVHLQISLSYWNQRRYDDSIEWANRALELDPQHLLAREHLAGAYWKQGDFDRHMAELVKRAETFGVPGSMLDPVRDAYRAGGRPGVVRYSLEFISKQPPATASVQLTILYAEAGDLDAAFRHLAEAIEQRDPCLVHLAVAPQWDALRADPRFNQCLARMGLRPASALQASL